MTSHSRNKASGRSVDFGTCYLFLHGLDWEARQLPLLRESTLMPFPSPPPNTSRSSDITRRGNNNGGLASIIEEGLACPEGPRKETIGLAAIGILEYALPYRLRAWTKSRRSAEIGCCCPGMDMCIIIFITMKEGNNKHKGYLLVLIHMYYIESNV